MEIAQHLSASQEMQIETTVLAPSHPPERPHLKRPAPPNAGEDGEPPEPGCRGGWEGTEQDKHFGKLFDEFLSS